MLKTYVAAKTRLLDLKDRLADLGRDEDGAAMMEYALLVGLVAVAAVAALGTLSGTLNNAFNTISDKLGAVGASGSGS